MSLDGICCPARVSHVARIVNPIARRTSHVARRQAYIPGTKEFIDGRSRGLICQENLCHLLLRDGVGAYMCVESGTVFLP